MAFSNSAYLDEVRAGLAKSGRPVLHFCLTAPIEVVRERLSTRGELQGDPAWSWVHRRAAECCEAHQAPAFATHVPTDKRPVIAAQLAALIG
jgi:predicted kinase